MHGERRQRLM